MSKLLTISIPTYNRFKFLKLCLEQLLPQVQQFQDEVEIYITDNCSSDGTEEYIRSLVNNYTFIKYNRNPSNIGYARNQVNCFLVPQTPYTAMLCDDDVYLPNALSTILTFLREKEYSLVAINYVGFTKTLSRLGKKVYAPAQDKIFLRGYDIMNYPSVGHNSALIFQTKGARKIVQQVLEKSDISYYENLRGVIFPVANELTADSDLPALFVGKRILACYKQSTLDYDGLKHLCIDYYNYFLKLYNEGTINASDLAYRKQLVEKRLLRSTFSSLCSTTNEQAKELWNDLEKSGLLNKHNRSQSRFIFNMALFPISKTMMKGIYKTYRLLKKHH